MADPPLPDMDATSAPTSQNQAKHTPFIVVVDGFPKDHRLPDIFDKLATILKEFGIIDTPEDHRAPTFAKTNRLARGALS